MPRLCRSNPPPIRFPLLCRLTQIKHPEKGARCDCQSHEYFFLSLLMFFLVFPRICCSSSSSSLFLLLSLYLPTAILWLHLMFECLYSGCGSPTQNFTMILTCRVFIQAILFSHLTKTQKGLASIDVVLLPDHEQKLQGAMC